MDEEKLHASFECFGLNQNASMDEVKKSFRKLCKLYDKESLATYSLLDDDDRQEKLESLQAAYDCILQSHQQKQIPAEDHVCEEDLLDSEIQAICLDVDPHQSPGLFLQKMREARGLSLKDVAERTKVSSYHLKCIEEQQLDVLPAPVYLRGFLREFSRMVKVADSEALIDDFMALYEQDN